MIKDASESSFFHNSQSFVFPIEEQNVNADEYIDDDDAGYEVFEIREEKFEESCQELALKYNFPNRAIRKEPKLNQALSPKNFEEDAGKQINSEKYPETKKLERQRLKEQLLNVKHKNNDSAEFGVSSLTQKIMMMRKQNLKFIMQIPLLQKK